VRPFENDITSFCRSVAGPHLANNNNVPTNNSSNKNASGPLWDSEAVDGSVAPSIGLPHVISNPVYDYTAHFWICKIKRKMEKRFRDCFDSRERAGMPLSRARELPGALVPRVGNNTSHTSGANRRNSNANQQQHESHQQQQSQPPVIIQPESAQYTETEESPGGHTTNAMPLSIVSEVKEDAKPLESQSGQFNSQSIYISHDALDIFLHSTTNNTNATNNNAIEIPNPNSNSPTASSSDGNGVVAGNQESYLKSVASAHQSVAIDSSDGVLYVTDAEIRERPHVQHRDAPTIDEYHHVIAAEQGRGRLSANSLMQPVGNTRPFLGRNRDRFSVLASPQAIASGLESSSLDQATTAASSTSNEHAMPPIPMPQNPKRERDWNFNPSQQHAATSLSSPMPMTDGQAIKQSRKTRAALSFGDESDSSLFGRGESKPGGATSETVSPGTCLSARLSAREIVAREGMHDLYNPRDDIDMGVLMLRLQEMTGRAICI
jgi:hypothetical protein